MMSKQLKNQSGYALFLTILLLVFISVTGLSLMTLSMNTTKITHIERDNQSTYYVAEAGIVETQAKIDSLVSQAFEDTKESFLDLTDEEKIGFDFKDEFSGQLQSLLASSQLLTQQQLLVLDAQYNKIPKAQVEVTQVPNQELTFTIASTGYFDHGGKIENVKRTSQTVSVVLGQPNDIYEVENTTTTISKLKACYAVQSYNTTTLGFATINGDVYSDKDISISNWAPINGSIISKGSITATGGNFKKDLIAYKNVTIDQWFDIGRNVIAGDTIHVLSGPGSLGGKFLYGNQLVPGRGMNNTYKAANFSEKIAFDTYMKTYAPSGEAECVKTIPSLPSIDATFPTNTLAMTNSTPDNKIVNGALKMSGGTPYTLVMNEDMYLKEVTVDNNLTLTIDLKGQDRKLYVDTFNIIQGHIRLINPGKLELIVKDSFALKGQVNQDRTKDLLSIKYKGNKAITLTGESNINGSLYLLNTPSFKVGNIGGGGVRGDLVIFNNAAIEFTGGSMNSESLILAPYSSLKMTSGAAVKGNIIIDRLNLENGSVTPPTQDSGSWEVVGEEVTEVEIPTYVWDSGFLQKGPVTEVKN